MKEVYDSKKKDLFQNLICMILRSKAYKGPRHASEIFNQIQRKGSVLGLEMEVFESMPPKILFNIIELNEANELLDTVPLNKKLASIARKHLKSDEYDKFSFKTYEVKDKEEDQIGDSNK